MKSFSSSLATLQEGGKKLRGQIAPFLKYLGLVTAFVLLYGWLFHVIMAWEGQDHTWFTGVYWALTVMSTLGFGDITFHTDLGRMFSSIVLLTGIILLLIILPFLFIRMVYAPWLEQRSRNRIRALQSLPPDIAGHVLICVNNPMALGLIERLRIIGIPAYVIEPDTDQAMRLQDSGIPVLNGEIDFIETYRAAGVERARLVFANASDMVNSSIILTVRELSKTVPVVALAEMEESTDVLELSGATHVLNLKQRLGEQLANRTSAGMTHATVIGQFHDLQLAEFPVHNTPFQDQTIRRTQMRKLTGVSIVGVWVQGKLLAAQPDLLLSPLCVVVVIGMPAQIKALNDLLVIHDFNPNPVLIIGGGKVGKAVAQALRHRKIPVHVVERNRDLGPEVADFADKYFLGDAANRQLLEEAGIMEAPSVLLTTHDDAMNIYLTVYCRRLNPAARILTRFSNERSVEAIHRAGADFVLSYTSLGIQSVNSIIQERELVLLGEGVDIFYLPLPPSLTDKSLAEAAIGASSGLNVIALRENGQIITKLSPDQQLAKGTVLVALGSPEQRERFRTAYD